MLKLSERCQLAIADLTAVHYYLKFHVIIATSTQEAYDIYAVVAKVLSFDLLVNFLDLSIQTKQIGCKFKKPI